MKYNLYIYYHQHSKTDYIQRYENTFSKIQKSGLIDEVVKIHVVTDSSIKNEKNGLVEFTQCSTHLSEKPTLDSLKHNAVLNDGYTLYLHSKGVSYPHLQPVQDWVDYMEYFLIEKYRDCLDSLRKSSDVIGVNYLEKPKKHFSGNFWWAKNSYIRTLSDEQLETRHGCEMWICSKNGVFKSLHQSNVNHYHTEYKKDKYAK